MRPDEPRGRVDRSELDSGCGSTARRRAAFRCVPRLVGEPAAGAVAGELQALPESGRWCAARRAVLASLDALTTSPVSLDGHAFTFEQTVSLIPPDPLVRVVQPARGHGAGADAAARRAAADRTGEGAGPERRSLTRRLFGTDGIRARFGEPPLDRATVRRAGRRRSAAR